MEKVLGTYKTCWYFMPNKSRLIENMRRGVCSQIPPFESVETKLTRISKLVELWELGAVL
jgi:hypothetical protein